MERIPEWTSRDGTRRIVWVAGMLVVQSYDPKNGWRHVGDMHVDVLDILKEELLMAKELQLLKLENEGLRSGWRNMKLSLEDVKAQNAKLEERIDTLMEQLEESTR